MLAARVQEMGGQYSRWVELREEAHCAGPAVRYWTDSNDMHPVPKGEEGHRKHSQHHLRASPE